MRSIMVPDLQDLDQLGPHDLERAMRQLDEAGRLIDALKAETVGVAERTAAYAEDGHASVSGWVKAACNYSSGETPGAGAVGQVVARHPRSSRRHP